MQSPAQGIRSTSPKFPNLDDGTVASKDLDDLSLDLKAPDGFRQAIVMREDHHLAFLCNQLQDPREPIDEEVSAGGSESPPRSSWARFFS